jgi:hypothetical protein
MAVTAMIKFDTTLRRLISEPQIQFKGLKLLAFIQNKAILEHQNLTRLIIEPIVRPNALKILTFIVYKGDIEAISPKRIFPKPQTQVKTPKLNALITSPSKAHPPLSLPHRPTMTLWDQICCWQYFSLGCAMKYRHV